MMWRSNSDGALKGKEIADETINYSIKVRGYIRQALFSCTYAL